MKKKILSLLAIVAILFVAMVTLTGCGDEESSSKSSKKNNSSEKNEVVTVSNEKVVYGKYVGSDGYDSDLEMTFSKDNRLTKFVLKYDCATEEAAKAFYNASLADIEETDTDMKIDGKKVTITMSAEGYMKMSGLTEDQLDEGTMRQVALGMKYSIQDTKQ